MCYYYSYFTNEKNEIHQGDAVCLLSSGRHWASIRSTRVSFSNFMGCEWVRVIRELGLSTWAFFNHFCARSSFCAVWWRLWSSQTHVFKYRQRKYRGIQREELVGWRCGGNGRKEGLYRKVRINSLVMLIWSSWLGEYFKGNSLRQNSWLLGVQ